MAFCCSLTSRAAKALSTDGTGRKYRVSRQRRSSGLRWHFHDRQSRFGDPTDCFLDVVMLGGQELIARRYKGDQWSV